MYVSAGSEPGRQVGFFALSGAKERCLIKVECSTVTLRNRRPWSAYLGRSHDHNNVFTTLATTRTGGREGRRGDRDREEPRPRPDGRDRPARQLRVVL